MSEKKKTPTVQSTRLKEEETKKIDFVFGRINYILLISGLFLLALGYILLIGGGSKDPNVFSYDLFNTQRMFIAPILLVCGFVVEVFAIMIKPKN